MRFLHPLECIYLLMGKLPSYCYDLMPLKRFTKIKRFMHFVDNDMSEGQADTLFKINAIIDAVRDECRKIDTEEFQAVDEQIIPSKNKIFKDTPVQLKEAEEVGLQESSSGSDISKEELDLSIEKLGCSAMKLIGHMDRVGYGERKLAQIGNAAQAKLADALGLDVETDTVDTSAQCCQSKQDLEALMKLIKAKFDIPSASEKVKSLTLVPDSWSIEASQSAVDTHCTLFNWRQDIQDAQQFLEPETTTVWDLYSKRYLQYSIRRCWKQTRTQCDQTLLGQAFSYSLTKGNTYMSLEHTMVNTLKQYLKNLYLERACILSMGGDEQLFNETIVHIP
eukprot:gene14951-6099_t